MLIIKNGKILTMTGQNYNKGVIVIKEGKIIEVGEEIKWNISIDDRVIDASGLWILPGIIEAHCHIGISEEKKGTEGEDCNEITDPVTPYLRALDGINPLDPAFHTAILAGITGVMVGPGSSNVVGGQFIFMKTHGRVVDKMIVKEPAAMKVAFGENPKKSYKDLNKPPSSRMTIAAMLREELFNARLYKKQKEEAVDNGEDFTIDFKKESWIPVLEKKIPLKAHVHRTDDIITAIRIAKEFGIGLTLDHCTEGHLIAEAIKESGFAAIVGPDMTCRNKIETQNADFKTAGVLAKSGVTVAITINPAIICGVSNRLGSIEVGKDADIAIFSGNPMEVFTHTVYTIIDGEIVYSYLDEGRV